jgi:hypothetical protein
VAWHTTDRVRQLSLIHHQIDRRANIVQINNETISLRDTNVVLTEIDKAGHVRITQRMRVDPDLPEPAEIDQHAPFRAVIRRGAGAARVPAV